MISPDSSVEQGYQYFGLQKFLVLGQVLKNFWRLFFCRLFFPSHKKLFFKASFYQFTKIILGQIFVDFVKFKKFFKGNYCVYFVKGSGSSPLKINKTKTTFVKVRFGKFCSWVIITSYIHNELILFFITKSRNIQSNFCTGTFINSKKPYNKTFIVIITF